MDGAALLLSEKHAKFIPLYFLLIFCNNVQQNTVITRTDEASLDFYIVFYRDRDCIFSRY